MGDESEVVKRLEALIEVTREGQRELKTELQGLREEFKAGQHDHNHRLSKLEEFMYRVRGVLAVTQVMTGASFLGAILAAAVAISIATR